MTDSLTAMTGIQLGLLSDQIYSLIKTQITDATLSPGEQLVESKIARKLTVSQAPVRDAMKRLAHEGLITHVRHQGHFVTTYTDEEAKQAKVARAELEGLAGRLTCGRLDEGHRARLAAMIDEMHQAAAEGDLGKFRELDFVFHRAVIEASGNVYLPRMWDILEPSLRSMHVLGDPKFEGDWHVVADWHRSLLEVLEGDDPAAASELFRAHAAGTLLTAGAAAVPAE